MKKVCLLLLFALLAAPVMGSGPMDGSWHDGYGNRMLIQSAVTNATLTFINPNGESAACPARYQGYTTLVVTIPGYGTHTIRMVNQNTLQMSGPSLNGYLYR